MTDVVVLGAGVIGLSIALELSSRGLKPAIVSRDLPEDVESVGFASPWAGCNWHTFETDGSKPEAEWDRITYSRLGELAKKHPDLCERIPFIDVWSKRVSAEFAFHKGFTQLREVEAAKDGPLPGGMPHAHLWNSYIINAPEYLKHLGKTARERGIRIIRKRVGSLDETYNIPEVGEVKLVINATGLGSKVLIGVEDEKVYPARGQTVLVHAPGVKSCVMSTEGFMAPLPEAGQKAPPETAYIIPRPGPLNTVVLGRTYIRNNYSSLPDLRESERILKACYDLLPALAGPKGKSWEDIEVVSHNVGLRPAREGGPRLELVERELGSGPKGLTPQGGLRRKRQVGFVHAYGFGSAGFQCSLGLAEKAGDLAVGYLKSSERSKL